MEQYRQDKSAMLLALIVGLSTHGTFSVFFNSHVPFSIFPIVSLALALYCLHQRYLNYPMAEGLPKLVTGCFFLGMFMYSAFIRMEYPAIGSNFLPVTIGTVLVFWIYLKAKGRKQLAMLASGNQG
ncbi:YijD family membrane protein [Xenorhabdus szentirmaii]|uniref:Inner membrane protein yijD n=2 Tax=Xenorhabdus szentirmaii TaxID=290112 RepID=W1J0B9_9GAMM|nr:MULTISPECIES: YijD family membrane protein [Xenorhabdus]MBD2781247.1 YijD family membrane protein [Xenorhabdus sp. 38]MBD2800436.1 YijD family membrane protein [Xenorhabdus sp. M]MBD2804110.1 YijD family membrane protein [Xenorhabdus sp. ZM]MBD2820390.1 YijD family membrane protein [Xenorhabdus sp. 42]PHM34289.1 membrane protein [Xenorhabdus szentirmaii DSM 16338]